MSRDENSLAHTVWNCKYHIVFVPKSDGVECYSKIRGKALFKIKIPYKYKSSILEDLDAAFINERTLFPDLENTIEYIKNEFKLKKSRTKILLGNKK